MGISGITDPEFRMSSGIGAISKSGIVEFFRSRGWVLGQSMVTCIWRRGSLWAFRLECFLECSVDFGGWRFSGGPGA